MKQLFSLIVILFCIQISFAKEGKKNWGKNVYYLGNIEAKKPSGTGTLYFLKQNTKIKDNQFVFELSGEFRNDTIYSTSFSIDKQNYATKENLTFEGDVYYKINVDNKKKTTDIQIELVRGTISIDSKQNKSSSNKDIYTKVKNYHISPSSKKGELKITYDNPYPALHVNLNGKCDELLIDGLSLKDFLIKGTYDNPQGGISIYSAYNGSINLSFNGSYLKKIETKNGFTSEFYDGAHGGGSSNLTRCRTIQASSFSATNKGEAEGTDVVYKDGKYTGTFTVPSWRPIDVLTKSEKILNSMQIIELKNGKFRYGEFTDTIKGGVNISEERRLKIEKKQKERQEGIAAFKNFFPAHQIPSNAPTKEELATPLFYSEELNFSEGGKEKTIPFKILMNDNGYIWFKYVYYDRYEWSGPLSLYFKFESGEIIELKATYEKVDYFFDVQCNHAYYNISPNLWQKFMFDKPIKIRRALGTETQDFEVKKNTFIDVWYKLYKEWEEENNKKNANPLSGF